MPMVIRFFLILSDCCLGYDRSSVLVVAEEAAAGFLTGGTVIAFDTEVSLAAVATFASEVVSAAFSSEIVFATVLVAGSEVAATVPVFAVFKAASAAAFLMVVTSEVIVLGIFVEAVAVFIIIRVWTSVASEILGTSVAKTFFSSGLEGFGVAHLAALLVSLDGASGGAVVVQATVEEDVLAEFAFEGAVVEGCLEGGFQSNLVKVLVLVAENPRLATSELALELLADGLVEALKVGRLEALTVGGIGDDKGESPASAGLW